MNDESLVLDLQKQSTLPIELAGGKGSNLCTLNQIPGIHVPKAFCISINAFNFCVSENQEFINLIRSLPSSDSNDATTKAQSEKIKEKIESIQLPSSLSTQIEQELCRYDDQTLFAIRSSANAEDLATASFAGQHDSFLNINRTDIHRNILQCWASLFTERAIAYRIKNNIEHHKVKMAVIVQEMVHPDASGVMFTADPVTSNRKELRIEAVQGYGDVFVSGETNARSFTVANDTISHSTAPDTSILPDADIAELASIGRTIEAYFGAPQDIEWCLADNNFYIVQSRPITTLFPIPETKNPGLRAYLSTGHQQMMTDAMKPLGISVFAASSGQYMHNAGGRIFYDVTDHLSSPSRNVILSVIGKSEILMSDALRRFIEKHENGTTERSATTPPPVNFDAVLENDPSVIDELIRQNETSLAHLKENIKHKKGPELIDFILADILQRKKEIFDSKNMAALTTSMNTAAWINEKLNEWLGLKNVADTLTQSAPGNITSEMGLALLDVADTIRGNDEMINYLEQQQKNSDISQQTDSDLLIEKLKQFNGGAKAAAAITSFLEKYGMRCVGEIDISKPRWIEQPSILIPMLLSNVRNFTQGAAESKFREGLETAEQKKHEILELLKQLPDGEEKASITSQKISLLRNFAGYREYPKYAYVCRYFEYKKKLLEEAEQMAAQKLLAEKEDLFYLKLEEIKDLMISRKADPGLIAQRKQDFRLFQKLTPPRVITSDGEIFKGEYVFKELPENAIVGLAVSSGTTEGRARVIKDFSDAKLQNGDILVTTFTDPSWTPVLVSISGLVTEVGGLMTHGSVIAREYGLPAVVGVENATKLIRDGQKIRLNGTEGFIELLD